MLRLAEVKGKELSLHDGCHLDVAEAEGRPAQGQSAVREWDAADGGWADAVGAGCWLTRLQSCLSKDSTYGKKSADHVGNRDYDKNQQHRGHCQQDDEGSKFLHVDMAALPDELEEAFPDSRPAGS